MLLVFPAYYADHDGKGPQVNVAIKIEDGKVKLKTLDEDVAEFPYTVYIVNRREYVSNSGAHSLEVKNIEPILILGRWDIYAFEKLANIRLLDEDLKPYGYSRPVEADEAYKIALELYADYARKPVLPDGAFLWRTSRGYIWVTLAKRVHVEDFLDAVEEYILYYVFARGV